jgi:hypothetical protein
MWSELRFLTNTDDSTRISEGACAERRRRARECGRLPRVPVRQHAERTVRASYQRYGIAWEGWLWTLQYRSALYRDRIVSHPRSAQIRPICRRRPCTKTHLAPQRRHRAPGSDPTRASRTLSPPHVGHRRLAIFSPSPFVHGACWN